MRHIHFSCQQGQECYSTFIGNHTGEVCGATIVDVLDRTMKLYKEMRFPKQILQTSCEGKGFLLQRFFSEEDWGIDASNDSIESISPFVVVSRGKRVLLTSRVSDGDSANYDYAVLTKKKPTRALFNAGEIEILSWIKHPLFCDESPESIADTWEGKFSYKKETPLQVGLRQPQLAATHAFLANETEKQRRIIVMPTGTGKTETMLSILIAAQCRKLLVLVPSDVLRGQLYDKFVTLGVLPRFGIVAADIKRPYVAKVTGRLDVEGWRDLLRKANVIITSMTLLAGCSPDVIRMMKSSFSNVFVDEAHHSEATTWDNVISSFSSNCVTLFTATPFRNDGKRIAGKFIYIFSLKDAQEQGYYKRINYCPVREYDPKLADKRIAEKAIGILKRDRENGYDHILMARCATIKRAKEIFQYYESYQEFSPVIVSSKTLGHKQIVEEIKRKDHKIIVCVNMLGEGFDLPEMKIAAIHDTRQSIPITLQFVGRFTREASKDAHLGEASFVANIANAPVKKELEDMYSQDADWNILLPELNDQLTEEEIDFSNFITSFNSLSNSNIAIQKINIPLSAVIYRITSNELRANDWKALFPVDQYQYRFSTTSGDGKTLLIVLGNTEAVDWGAVDSVQNIVWNLIVVHREMTPNYKHAYFYSTCNVNYTELADTLFGGVNLKIDGGIVFRAFHDVKRFLTFNFGGRNKGDISFKSFYGKDVENAIGDIEKKRLVKNNIFGNGYLNGDRISLGCSIKGKIWSFMRGNLLMYNKWVKRIGALIEDKSIDEDEIWENTLRPSRIVALPDTEPICVDWDSDIYAYTDQRIGVTEADGRSYAFWEIELNLLRRDDPGTVKFELRTPEKSAEYVIRYGNGISGNRNYLVEQVNGSKFAFTMGPQIYEDIARLFNEEYPPTINFADGSQLYGDTLTASPDDVKLFDRDRLEVIDWAGVDIKNESMHVPPYETDSIQYFIANKIKDDYTILYDDDNSGEIADLIGIREDEKEILISLYHLKFANGGRVSNKVDNLYEVCGQAEKSLAWKNKEISAFFRHLFARKTKKYQNREGSRLLKGTEEELERLRRIANRLKRVRFEITIVQPSISKTIVSEDILVLLGTTETYIKDYSNINFHVICSH